MNSKLIVLFNSDIIFYITDFLDDKSSFRLFNTNKYYHTIISKYPSRYTIKKYVEDYNPNLSLVIKYKIINYEHTENICINYIPNTVKNMIFGNLFNKKVTNLPVSLNCITFGYSFNNCVDNLPNNLQYLRFGDCFNQSVDNLPRTLKQIYFGKYFDQPVDHLPSSLEKIVFGDCFNKTVDNLPKSLVDVVFGIYFDKPVDHLPENLKRLTLKTKFNKPLNNLPMITHLTLSKKYKLYKENLPKSLISLNFGI